MDYIVEQEI